MKNEIFYDDARIKIKKFPDNYFPLIILDPGYQGIINKDWDKKDLIKVPFILEIHRILKESGSLYCWCGIGEKSDSYSRWKPIINKIFHFKDLITWKKQRGNGNRKGWLQTSEYLMWFVKDNKKFIWNKKNQYSDEKRAFNIVKKGGIKVNKSDYKRLTNVWNDIKEVGFGTSPKKFKEIRDKIKHQTPKPSESYERIILVHTKPGDIVLDCTGGSGPIIDACKNTGRYYIYIDNDIFSVNIAREKVNKYHYCKNWKVKNEWYN